MKPTALLAAALLALPACAGAGAADGAPADGPGTTSAPAAEAPAPPPEAKPGEAAPAPAPPPEMPAPAGLGEGDRWFVAVRAALGSEPVAERYRRRRVEGVLREEVTWGRTFAAVAGAEHGVAQVFSVHLDGKGLGVALLDAEGRLLGEPRLEVAAPYRAGNEWTVDPGSGTAFHARIEGIEEADTPGGKVKALRVRVTSPRPRPIAMTTWYDAGLRPVRSEVRWTDAVEVIEARAALASAAPTPEECRAAVAWAKQGLPPIER